jgi:hypothetical protein
VQLILAIETHYRPGWYFVLLIHVYFPSFYTQHLWCWFYAFIHTFSTSRLSTAINLLLSPHAILVIPTLTNDHHIHPVPPHYSSNQSSSPAHAQNQEYVTCMVVLNTYPPLLRHRSLIDDISSSTFKGVLYQEKKRTSRYHQHSHFHSKLHNFQRTAKMITGIAHINLIVPEGTLDLAEEFYSGILGFTRVPVPVLQKDKLAWYFPTSYHSFHFI